MENVEEMLGHVVEVSWSYRFGRPGRDVVRAGLERATVSGTELIGRSFRLPATGPLERGPAAVLGVRASLVVDTDRGEPARSIITRHLVGDARAIVRFASAAGAFCVAPDGERRIALRPFGDAPGATGGSRSALKLSQRMALPGPREP